MNLKFIILQTLMEKSDTILWVGKLPRDITSTEIEKEFSRFGKIFEISMRKYYFLFLSNY